MIGSTVKRSVRVAERLREELSANVRALRDPRVANVLVSRVVVTDDLQQATVYVRLEQGAAQTDTKAALQGLEAASGRLRRDMGRGVGLRYVPKLRFFYDEGPEKASRVEELLREIHDEDAKKPGPEEG